MKKTIVLLALAGLVLALASAAQAGTVDFTSSTQLNLAGRDVLAAVSFHDSTRGNVLYDATPTPTFYQDIEDTLVTGTIQGVTIQNFDWQVSTTLSLSAGGTLELTNLNTPIGRANFVGSIFGANGDEQEQAGRFATDFLTDNNGPTIGTLTFTGLPVSTDVEVQMTGGGAWEAGSILSAQIDGVEMGIITSKGNATYGVELLTFAGTTDSLGGLEIDLTSSNKYKAGVNGVIVTVPEPATMLLLGLGGLVLRRRKRA